MWEWWWAETGACKLDETKRAKAVAVKWWKGDQVIPNLNILVTSNLSTKTQLKVDRQRERERERGGVMMEKAKGWWRGEVRCPRHHPANRLQMPLSCPPITPISPVFLCPLPFSFIPTLLPIQCSLSPSFPIFPLHPSCFTFMSILSFFCTRYICMYLLRSTNRFMDILVIQRDEIKLRVKSYKLVVDVCNNLLVFMSWDLRLILCHYKRNSCLRKVRLK